MPLKYKIFQNRKLVYVLGIGEVSYEDLLLHIKELAADPINVHFPNEKISRL